MSDKSPPLLIVTGLSGAGMSSALKDLEDMGYEVFDNFPPALVAPLVRDEDNRTKPVAVGIDARARGFSAEAVLAMVEHLGARLLFLTADEAVLQKRFTETRRRHPLAKDRPVAAGISKEKELLQALQAAADHVVDTSELSVHELRHVLAGHFALDARALTVTLMSFGFRFGIPREADIVMDIRFLKNPHWEKDLRPLTGQDAKVAAYIKQDANFAPFLVHFQGLVGPLLPLYAREGKSYLTVAVGCTGGRHRSVFTVETLKPWLEKQGFALSVLHRDIGR
jgi:RNase adapter protein RapZ